MQNILNVKWFKASAVWIRNGKRNFEKKAVMERESG